MSVLIIAAVAVAMIVMAPICMAANVGYPNPETALANPFYVDWYNNPTVNPVSPNVYNGDTIGWFVYFEQADSSTGALSPRLNEKFPGSTTGSDEPTYTLSYGYGRYLGAQTTVSGTSGQIYTLYDSVTYHRVDYPYNNAIAQSSNFQFWIA